MPISAHEPLCIISATHHHLVFSTTAIAFNFLALDDTISHLPTAVILSQNVPGHRHRQPSVSFKSITVLIGWSPSGLPPRTHRRRPLSSHRFALLIVGHGCPPTQTYLRHGHTSIRPIPRTRPRPGLSTKSHPVFRSVGVACLSSCITLLILVFCLAYSSLLDLNTSDVGTLISGPAGNWMGYVLSAVMKATTLGSHIGLPCSPSTRKRNTIARFSSITRLPRHPQSKKHSTPSRDSYPSYLILFRSPMFFPPYAPTFPNSPTPC